MNIRHFHALPRAAAAYPKILAGLRKKPAREPQLPQMQYIAENLTIDSRNLARYNAVCGYPYNGTVPAVYPAVLAQSLQMHMMTDDGGFPFPALGLIHIANRVSQYRPIRAGEILQLSCATGTLRGHEKGAVFDFISHVRIGGETVFEGSSTYLARLANPLPDAEDSAQAEIAAENLHETAQIKAPDDIGRRYARISGDYNPIHLYPFTAKMFGFKGQIAHGMWSKARVLAALPLPEAYCAEVRFKLPVFLPAKLTLLAGSANAGRQDFLLQSAKDSKPHLSGFWQAL